MKQIRTITFIVGVVTAGLVLAGCGGSSSADEASATPSPTATTAGVNADLAAPVGTNPDVDPVAMAAYEKCVVENGGTMPDPLLEGAEAHAAIDAKTQAAFDTCRPLYPEGAEVPGANGKRNTVEFRAFQACMADAGVTVGGPGTGSGATGGESTHVEGEETAEEEEVPTFGLDLTDAKIAKAVKTCNTEFVAAQRAAANR